MQCTVDLFIGFVSHARKEGICCAGAQGLFKRTQLNVNSNKTSQSESFKQVQETRLVELLWLYTASLPEGMVVDLLEPGATPGLLRRSSFFVFKGDFTLKGDESHNLLFPAVDDVPAGHCWGKWPDLFPDFIPIRVPRSFLQGPQIDNTSHWNAMLELHSKWIDFDKKSISYTKKI